MLTWRRGTSRGRRGCCRLSISSMRQNVLRILNLSDDYAPLKSCPSSSNAAALTPQFLLVSLSSKGPLVST